MSARPRTIAAIAAGSLVCLGAAAGAAVLSHADFDYATASEQAQQRFLERLGASLGKKKFEDSLAGFAEIERIEADARWDRLDVDMRFTGPAAETLSEHELDAVTHAVYAANCPAFEEKNLFQEGVTMNVRMKRPSGGALANVVFDETACAPFAPESQAD